MTVMSRSDCAGGVSLLTLRGIDGMIADGPKASVGGAPYYASGR
jgi:hypothetical protein